MSERPRVRRPRKVTDQIAPAAAPAATALETAQERHSKAEPTAAAPARYVVGSYGNASIDRHDAHFVAASHAVEAAKGVRVDPRVLKAVMGLESGEDGSYPVDRCRASDGHPGPRACGPMQIKWAYHQQRCPSCDRGTVAGHVEMAAHILADAMKANRCDEYEAYVRGYLTSDDVNGTSQREAVAGLRRRVARMEADARGGASAPAPDPWRPYPWPTLVDLVVAKPGENAGFTRCAPRAGRIRGFCTHITDGPPSQTIEFFRDFFGTGGARAWDALTDLVIGWDGRIGLLNDWRDPQRGGTRAGWANGGTDGLEGEGVAFYRRFPAINEVLVSCEHAQQAGKPWSDAMLASTIEVRTALAQELRCPAESYPFHPAYGGVSIEQQHRNFATKSCPANPYVSEYDRIVRAEVKAKLARHQGGGASVPTEPAQTYTRFGFTKEAVEQFFGTITRFNRDGTQDRFGFDWNGALSLFWLRRAETTGVFPEAERIWFMDAEHIPGREETWASFEGGLTAYLPAGERAAWTWLDGWTPEAAA